MATSISLAAPEGYELRFVATGRGGHDYAFPCDAQGRVDLDALPERQRCDYFFARAVMGRDLAWPVVVTVHGPPAPPLPWRAGDDLVPKRLS